MHDLGFFRANLETIAERLATRGYTLDLAAFQDLDTRRRAALSETENLKAARNAASTEIGKLKRQGADTEVMQTRVREMGDRITVLDREAGELETEYRALLARIPIYYIG